jgi:hypothetical protein
MPQKIILKNAIEREKGKLYFVDGKGNVVEAILNRKGGKKGRTFSKVKST